MLVQDRQEAQGLRTKQSFGIRALTHGVPAHGYPQVDLANTPGTHFSTSCSDSVDPFPRGGGGGGVQHHWRQNQRRCWCPANQTSKGHVPATCRRMPGRPHGTLTPKVRWPVSCTKPKREDRTKAI